jgi:hypothetical protein
MLIAICLLAAFLVAARGYLAWRALGHLSDSVVQRTEAWQPDRRAVIDRTQDLRGRIADANAEIEKQFWALTSFDDWSDRAIGELRVRREQLDGFRAHDLEQAGEGVARLRQAVALYKRLSELRRTILG